MTREFWLILLAADLIAMIYYTYYRNSRSNHEEKVNIAERFNALYTGILEKEKAIVNSATGLPEGTLTKEETMLIQAYCMTLNKDMYRVRRKIHLWMNFSLQYEKKRERIVGELNEIAAREMKLTEFVEKVQQAAETAK